jgi:hypothetical protein
MQKKLDVLDIMRCSQVASFPLPGLLTRLYIIPTGTSLQMLEELGVALVVSLVFSNVVFWPIKLQGSWVVFWLVYFTTLSTGIVLAYFVAALSPNMDVANAALPAYVVTLLFFAGKIFVGWYLTKSETRIRGHFI